MSGRHENRSITRHLVLFTLAMLMPWWAGAEQENTAPTTGTQPQFTPGIPGLKMVDVRDHKFLWREIEELQAWEQSDRISVAEYRSKVVEKTVHFLGLQGAAGKEFAAAAAEEVEAVRTSFHERRPEGEDAGGYPSGLGRDFFSDLGAAETRLSALLGDEPRHQLFAPECKKWLLKLAFGPRERKEAAEANPAQAGS